METRDLGFIPAADLEGCSGGRTGSLRLAGLYVRGSLAALAGPTVAVVGTRAPSDAGRRLAHRISEDLARAGLCVVSGLALGVDSAAHRGALAGGGPTIGVLGGGHAHFYPPANRDLAESIVAGGGAVVSPFAPDHAARPAQFLQRNAVIAALADGVVVVEAAARSGSLNTAAWAADAGKPVMAFPGDVDRPKVAGCLALIRDGALLVRNAADIVAALPSLDCTLPFDYAPSRRSAQGDNDAERAILRILQDNERDVDALLAALDRDPGEVLAALASLELAGAIERRGGRSYACTCV